jgi:hypothetical protein
MARIPIDMAPPIACTATTAELDTRLAQVNLMRDRIGNLERASQRLVLHLDRDADLEGRGPVPDDPPHRVHEPHVHLQGVARRPAAHLGCARDRR